MELKDYQSASLEVFSQWLRELKKAEDEYFRSIEFFKSVDNVPSAIQNYPSVAWNNLAKRGGVASSAGQYLDRFDGNNRPIPHVCFKVPTGGGKTLLAATVLERLNQQNGLILWITPTRAIYEQTKAALWNREHPYRKILERAGGGSVLMLEKEDVFTYSDVANKFCVMLLMLHAVNRRDDMDFLKINRDSGRYLSFFPDDDNILENYQLSIKHPDLDKHSHTKTIKHSLLNVLKQLRPIAILDEAHKAYGANRTSTNQNFVQSVNRLNPRLVVELSATPNQDISNLLVDVSGVDLKKEEMIKLPVQVTTINVEWQDTLTQAHRQLETLISEAKQLQSNEGRYIRPIAVVRVERTGKDKRDGKRIHAEDVRDYLIQKLSVLSENVRVKSSEKDELKNEHLLSKYSSVQWIITKAALMEGWDCSFAYVLVLLDNTTSQKAITQLVGRVLRQPHAMRTGYDLLDQCYVYCWKIDVETAVSRVKDGLEYEGLTGLNEDVIGQSNKINRITLRRRELFSESEIFLPLVLHKSGSEWAELDYRRHILSEIDWGSLDAPDPCNLQVYEARSTSIAVDLDIDLDETLIGNQSDQTIQVDKKVKLSWFTHRLSDLIPNPWQAARIVENTIEKLLFIGETEATIYDRRDALSLFLRESMSEEIEKLAEKVFIGKLGCRQIRFDLETQSYNFKMKHSFEIPIVEGAGLIAGNDGKPMKLNLFEPMHTQHFDTNLERNFARYLDEQMALTWWHRVAVRQSGEYYLRGWRETRIWPDFVAMATQVDGNSHLLVFETKGKHLSGNEDTEYKKRVLSELEGAFNLGRMNVHDGPAEGTFRLIFEGKFGEALSNLENFQNC